VQLINYDLIKHPLNWATVILMLFIASLALHLILTAVTGPARSTSTTSTAT
jgi:hypothetical protein